MPFSQHCLKIYTHLSGNERTRQAMCSNRHVQLSNWGALNAGSCNRSDRWVRPWRRCSRVGFPPTAPSGEAATCPLGAAAFRAATVGRYCSGVSLRTPRFVGPQPIRERLQAPPHKHSEKFRPVPSIASTIEHIGEPRLGARDQSCIRSAIGTQTPWHDIRWLRLSLGTPEAFPVRISKRSPGVCSTN